MKPLTTILAAAMVMAATGCETPQEKEARGLVRTQAGKWVPKGTSFFGSGHMGPAPAGVAFDPTVFNQAMAAQMQAPTPVVVTGPGSGTTLVTQSSMGTVVSQIGGNSPTTPPILPPINTGSSTPVVYTMPLQQ